MALVFHLRAVGHGALDLAIDQPVWDEGVEAWACRARWSGAIEGGVRIYGASSLQSVSLALAHLQIELPAALGGADLTEDGHPWF
jgi:hypothetical protein